MDPGGLVEQGTLLEQRGKQSQRDMESGGIWNQAC